MNHPYKPQKYDFMVTRKDNDTFVLKIYLK